MDKQGNAIKIKTGLLIDAVDSFLLISKGNFASGKTILRMSKIARQFWAEIETANLAINEVYRQHGEYDEKVKNYRVKPEQIPTIEPEIKAIREEIVEINGTKFQLEDLWFKGEIKESGSLPEFLTADLLYKLDWLIELPDEI